MRRFCFPMLKACCGSFACFALLVGLSSPPAYASSTHWSAIGTQNRTINGYHVIFSLQAQRTAKGAYTGHLRTIATVVVPENSTLPANLRLEYVTNSNNLFLPEMQDHAVDRLVTTSDTQDLTVPFTAQPGSSVSATLSLTDATGSIFMNSRSLFSPASALEIDANI
jgi:hypothetical protein